MKVVAKQKRIVPKENCSGCSACYSACPSNAISMQRDGEGFLYPIIDLEKCTDCGLCRRICPVLNKDNKKEHGLDPVCYAAWNKDESVRMDSSSGGIFSSLAKYVLKNNGFVCGASFDNENQLKHIIISNEKDLPKIRGAKYLQSEIGNVFYDIQKLLQDNKNVLFAGTPCQVAGLNAFLRKEYDRLITVDVVCHGTPSPLVFDRYIKDIEQSAGEKIEEIKFRDKSTGWKTYSLSLGGKGKSQIYKNIFDQNDFGRGFLSNLYLKPLCTECPFTSIHRNSDITLGDFWGIWNYKKELDDDKGTSLVLVNSVKGAATFTKVKNEIFSEEVPVSIAQSGNLVLNMPCDRHPNREDFFREFSKNRGNVGKAISNYLDDDYCVTKKDSVGIFNMRLPSCNFGATLQAFALQKSIERLGYDAKVINYISDIPENNEDKFCNLGFYKFRERFIRMTPVCKTDEDLVKLNRLFSTFVVGSDQVWNYNYLSGVFKENIGKYFLDFVVPSRNILSYAASFAENHWDGTTKEINQVKEALKKFSAVSVRESDGVKICRELFDVEATRALDPTFLLNEEDYQEIIESEVIEKTEDKYIAYFTLDEKLENRIKASVSVKNIVQKIGGKLINIRGNIREVYGKKRFVFNTIPVWLNYIKSCEFIITDSYHCAILAIIFKKQFIIIARDYAGNSRFDSLLTTLRIKNRIFKKIGDVKDVNFLNDPIDYIKAYEILDFEKEKSLNYLVNSLKAVKPGVGKDKMLEDELIFTKLAQSRLGRRSQELDSENQVLQSENQVLKNETEKLQDKNRQLSNRKAIRYSDKIGGAIRKIAIKIK